MPTDDRYDQGWQKLDFDDSNWKQGQNGAGYEQNNGYQDWISPEFDFKREMYNQTNSLYLRFPFEIDNLPQILAKGKLILKLKYDEDCVAIMAVHYAGHPLPMDDLVPWARKRNLKILLSKEK